MRSPIAGFTIMACIALVWLTGCRPRIPAEVAVEQVDVVDQPYPANYPASAPINPRTVATLHRGDRVYVRDQRAEKDFMYYAVELQNGQRGYVIFSGEWPFRQRSFFGVK
ncbi:MAG: hypothetical protein ACJ8M4_04910 [Chthoniobacterales bacterium]